MEDRRKMQALNSLENYFEGAVAGTFLNGTLNTPVTSETDIAQINSKGIEYNRSFSEKKGQVEDISEFEKVK